MKYKLLIQKMIENPNYKEANGRNYFPNNDIVQFIPMATSLECELTEEEFIKFKAEILKIYA